MPTRYQVKDQYFAPGLPQVMEYQHYYPFGMQLEALGYTSGNDLKNNYLYNGKELQEDYNLNWYDYGARMYDPVIGRWSTVDPLVEANYSISPYTFCSNNPINRTDPTGMLDDWYTDSDGTMQFDPRVKSQANLKANQKYIGETYIQKGLKENTIAEYRNDGSIKYTNETDAYNRMWNQAHNHYKNNKEVGGFTLKLGGVLVLPDYANTVSEMGTTEYGYSVDNGSISSALGKFKVTGLMHTHQNPKVGAASPSVYTGDGYGDLGISKVLGGLPVMTLGYGGYIHDSQATASPPHPVPILPLRPVSGYLHNSGQQTPCR